MSNCWVTTDPHGLILDASESWHELWGFAPSESLGKNVSILNGQAALETTVTYLLAKYSEDISASKTDSCVSHNKSGSAYSHDVE